MAKAPKTYININGDVRDAASLTKPASREFRDAWQFNGDAVEVDMAKAKEIRLGQLVSEAAQEADKAEKEALKAAFRGQNAKAQKDKTAKFKGDPSPAGVAAIAAASTTDELAALVVTDLF